MRERDLDNGARNFWTIFVTGIIFALLADIGIFVFERQRENNHYPVHAQVTDLSYQDLSGKGRYARTLTVNLRFETAGGYIEKVVTDGSSDERPQFAKKTKPGDRITVWIDRRSGEISLFEQSKARLFSSIGITFPTIGLIAAMITALIVGKTVHPRPKKSRRI